MLHGKEKGFGHLALSISFVKITQYKIGHSSRSSSIQRIKTTAD